MEISSNLMILLLFTTTIFLIGSFFLVFFLKGKLETITRIIIISDILLSGMSAIVLFVSDAQSTIVLGWPSLIVLFSFLILYFDQYQKEELDYKDLIAATKSVAGMSSLLFIMILVIYINSLSL